MSPRLLRLAGIGTAGGAFSGLFGIGGGTVIVPLLVLWLGYEQREATGTTTLVVWTYFPFSIEPMKVTS